jgi:mitosis inhibitor protein kinase SWE1
MFERPTQPHPLSRTLTQSSSNSSVPDESPTHIPVHIGEKPRIPLSSSKSLPLGVHRPTDNELSVATPQYRSAIPYQAAFMSIGLVSKTTRNPEYDHGKNGGAKTSFMPDMPCKKKAYSSNTYPIGRRPPRPSLGSPDTPFNPMLQPARKLESLFKLVRKSHSRRGSLLSLEGDDGQGGADENLPPTQQRTFSLSRSPLLASPT